MCVCVYDKAEIDKYCCEWTMHERNVNGYVFSNISPVEALNVSHIRN